jgi:hypothetical protein
VLCSGHGQYLRGTCRCLSGWTGPECEQKVQSCDHESCGENGSCIGGICVCSPAFSGSRCERFASISTAFASNRSVNEFCGFGTEQSAIILESFEDAFYTTITDKEVALSQGLFNFKWQFFSCLLHFAHSLSFSCF